MQVTTAGMEALTPLLLEALDAVIAPKTVILRNDTPSRALEGLDSYVRAARGEAARIGIEENGARYFADPSGGQKTGWYYDQRDNADAVAQSAAKGFRDEIRVVDRTLYLHTPEGYGRSDLAAALMRIVSSPKAGTTGTARNWATMTKLLALCAD